MIRIIEERCRTPQFTTFKSLPRDAYLRLLSGASALVGNSSSGIVEASFLGTPFINVGDRQRGRERGGNVVDVGYGTDEVLGGLMAIESSDFQRRLRETNSPYGDWKTGERIAELLASIQLKPGVTQKILSYDI